MSSAQQRYPDTVVREPWLVLGLVWAGFPLSGVGAGLLLAFLADRLDTLDWLPGSGVIDAIASAPQPWTTIALAAVGLVLGLVVAGMGAAEMLVLTVSSQRVIVDGKGPAVTIVAGDIAAACYDDRQLVVFGKQDDELSRDGTDIEPDRLREVFTGAGYRWLPDGDPHHDEFRQWVPATPDLPDAANALLEARRTALRKDENEDAALMRIELARLGIVVKDVKKRQFWRRSRRRPETSGH